MTMRKRRRSSRWRVVHVKRWLQACMNGSCGGVTAAVLASIGVTIVTALMMVLFGQPVRNVCVVTIVVIVILSQEWRRRLQTRQVGFQVASARMRR